MHFPPEKKGIPVTEVATIVDQVFRENYGGTYPDGYGTETGSTLEEVLYELTDATDDGALQSLKTALIENDSYLPQDGEEAYYDDEYDYHKLERSDRYGILWQNFHQHLKHEQRFFSSSALDILREIFEGVERQRDKIRRSPVYMIYPGKRNAFYYRARVAHDHGEVRKFMEAVERELAPPPERLRKQGRLNPAGIATFYGAFDLDTCVAELRPSVGSLVASARFTVTEPMCVLDTTRFATRPRSVNIYRRDEVKRAAQWNFMQDFAREISKPISPGNEYLDYIPTQAVAEYLVNHHAVRIDGETRQIDAIIYSSAQRLGGRNIAILGAAGVVGQAVDEKPRRPKSDRGDIFEFMSSWGRQKTRIIPVAKSFGCYAIEGASFDKRNYFGEATFGDDEGFSG